MAKNERFGKLRQWMWERDITHKSIAERIGMAESTVATMLKSPHIPTKRHAQLIQLGIPPEVLPVPLDKRNGRPPKTPRFPVDENR